MKDTGLPSELKILGSIYKIQYLEKPSDVDVFKRQSLWGQVDYWTHTIRIYTGSRDHPDTMFTPEEIWRTILHEAVHAIVFELHIDSMDYSKDESRKVLVEKDVDLMATGLRSLLFDNGFVYKEKK